MMTIIDNTDTEQNIAGFIEYPIRWRTVQCQLFEFLNDLDTGSSLMVQTFLDARSSSGIYPNELTEVFHGGLIDLQVSNNISNNTSRRNIEDVIRRRQDVDSESINQELIDAHSVLFIAAIESLVEQKGITTALRYLYDEIDELLWSGNFDECNRILRVINCHSTDLKLLIGYLTITLPWKQHLTERAPLVQQIREVALKRLPESRVDRLLMGLT